MPEEWFGLLWNVKVDVVYVVRMKYNSGGGYSSALERMLCKVSAESFFRPSYSYVDKKKYFLCFSFLTKYRDLMTGHGGKTMSFSLKGISCV